MRNQCALFIIFFTLLRISLFAQQEDWDVVAGLASWYGEDFHGKLTANGEVYDMTELTAAHRTLPFGTKVKVVNLLNNRSVIVRINDRGPFKEERIIDVSKAAAEELDFIRNGIVPVRIEMLVKGEGNLLDFSADKKSKVSSLDHKVDFSQATVGDSQIPNVQFQESKGGLDRVSAGQTESLNKENGERNGLKAKESEQKEFSDPVKENLVYIQVGSYQEKVNALRTATLLADSGFGMKVREKNGYYRVFFEQDSRRVNDSLRLLQNQGYKDPLVRRTPVEGVEIDWRKCEFFE